MVNFDAREVVRVGEEELGEQRVQASPSIWRQVARALKKEYGVKRFAGDRVTGFRRTLERERIAEAERKGVKYTRVAVSPEFSVSEYKKLNDISYSLTRIATKEEVLKQKSKFIPSIQEKMFLNVPEGTEVSARPNLNGTLEVDGKEIALTTVHKKTGGEKMGDVLSYQNAVVLENPLMFVGQNGRGGIASGLRAKFPMAAGRGKYTNKKPFIGGKLLTFNPKDNHLFTDESGFAVKGVKGDVSFYSTGATYTIQEKTHQN